MIGVKHSVVLRYCALVAIGVLLHACSDGTPDQGKKVVPSSNISIAGSQRIFAGDFDIVLSCQGNNCAELYYTLNDGAEQIYDPITILRSDYPDNQIHLTAYAKDMSGNPVDSITEDFYIDDYAPTTTYSGGFNFASTPPIVLECFDMLQPGQTSAAASGCDKVYVSLSAGGPFQEFAFTDTTANGRSVLIKNLNIGNGDKLYYKSADLLKNIGSAQVSDIFNIDAKYSQVRNVTMSALSIGIEVHWDNPEDGRYNEYQICRTGTGSECKIVTATFSAQFINADAATSDYEISSRIPGTATWGPAVMFSPAANIPGPIIVTATSPNNTAPANPNLGVVSLTTQQTLDTAAYTLSGNDLELVYLDKRMSGTNPSYVAGSGVQFDIPKLNLLTPYLATFRGDIRSVDGELLPNNHTYTWNFVTQDGQWQPSITLDSGDAKLDAGVYAYADQNDYAMMLWQRAGSTSEVVSREGPVAGNWPVGSIPKLVSEPGYQAVNPKLRMNNKGEAVAAWFRQVNGLPQSLYIRRYSTATGWDTLQPYLLTDNLVDPVAGSSGNYDVAEFDLDISDQGDVFVLWTDDVTLGSSEKHVWISHFNFNATTFGTLPNVATYPAVTLSNLIESPMLKITPSSNTNSGTAHCLWLEGTQPNTKVTSWTFTLDPSRLIIPAPAPETLPFVDAAGVYQRAPVLTGNDNGDLLAAWVEVDNPGTTTSVDSFAMVARLFDGSSWGAPTLLASSAEAPQSNISAVYGNRRTANPIAGQAYVSWADSASIWVSRYTGAFGWEANNNQTPKFAFEITSKPGVKAIRTWLDATANLTLAWAANDNIYVLRKDYAISTVNWVVKNLSETALHSAVTPIGSAKFNSVPWLLQSRYGDLMAAWVGGISSDQGVSGLRAQYNNFTLP